MRYIFLLSTFIGLLASMPSLAETFTIGGFKYETLYDGTVSIAKADNAPLNGDVIIPSSVNYQGAMYEVSSVARWGFQNMNIGKLVLPTTIIEIGQYAFYSSSIEEIESHIFFPMSNDAFDPNSKLRTKLYVPKESLEYYKETPGWSECATIEERELTDINKDPLRFVIQSDNEVEVKQKHNDIRGDIVIPEKVEIGGKEYVVYYFDFSSCEYITSISLPKTVVPFVLNSPFGGCKRLKEIKVSPENERLKVINGCLIVDNYLMVGYAHAQDVEELVVPEEVNYFSGGVFSNNEKLTSVVLPSKLVQISEYLFSNCTKLENVQIPESVTSICSSAFWGSAIKKIILLNSVESVESRAFADCNNLDSVIVKKATHLGIEDNVFSEKTYREAVLVVPIGRSRFFKNAIGWGNFQKIEEMEMSDVEISTSPYDNIEENQMVLSYLNTPQINNNGYGGANPGLYKACIGFSKAQMDAFTGNYIKNVRFALTDTKIKDVKLWIGSARDKKDIFEQPLENIVEGWNEVLLSKPVYITGDSIFIGIEYYQDRECYPLSWIYQYATNGNGNEKGSCYIFGPYNGIGNESVWYDKSGDYTLSMECIVEGDKIPLYNIHIVRIDGGIKKYIKRGESFSPPTLYYRNWGKKSVSSVTFICEVDGEEVRTETVSQIGKEINSVYFWYLPFDTQSLSSGLHTITIRVKDINGEAPQYTADATASVNVKLYTQDMGRDKVMLELFTATWCPNSPYTSGQIAQFMEQHDDIVLVSYHVDDEMSSDASDAYGIFTEWIPTFIFDRKASVGATRLSDSSISTMVSDFENAKAMPSLAKLHIQVEYNESSYEVNITVKGIKNEEFMPVEDYANLTVMLTEDKMVYPQYDRETEKYIYNYVHNGVVRTIVSSVWGDPVTWNNDDFEMHYTLKLDEDWMKDNMKVVAFLAKPFTGSNYGEINLINCNDFALRNAVVISGIKDHLAQDVSIYMNGRNVVINGEYDSMQIYTASGMIVDNNNLLAGTYIVKIRTRSGIVVKKILVK